MIGQHIIERGETLSIPQTILKAPSYTYFKDRDDTIYYSVGAGTHPIPGLVRSVAVYHPTENLKTNRISQSSNQQYEKVIVNGGHRFFKTSEKALEWEKKAYSKMQNHQKTHPVTGEPFIGVPADNVTQIYDSHNALIHYLSDGHIIDIRRELELICRLLMNEGIPLEAIGLYGGFQTHIIHDNGEPNGRHDFDLTIQGIEYVGVIKYLSHKYGKYRSYYSDEPLIAAKKRRESVLTLMIDCIGQVDFKFIRDSQEVEFIRPDLPPVGNDVVIMGTVLDNDQVGTTPAYYRVQTTQGNTIVVSTCMYEFIGAAWKGDTVKIKGKSDWEGNVVIIEPHSHYVMAIDTIG